LILTKEYNSTIFANSAKESKLLDSNKNKAAKTAEMNKRNTFRLGNIHLIRLVLK
jgi:hypothetical protein